MKPSQMDFFDSVKLCEKFGVNFIQTMSVSNEKELEKAFLKIKFPWAMKVVGKNIIHKSDVGGVKLHLENKKDALNAFRKMIKIKGAKKVAVQTMKEGVELIIGGMNDAQFGPVLLVGFGGIYTEVWKDTSMRVCPVEEKDASEMLKELTSYPILKGIRGKKGIPLKQLTKMLVNVSKLMMKNNIQELDLNPVIGTPTKVEAVDVRIIQ
jgi:succinyl-CoA synthetase beta subunit